MYTYDTVSQAISGLKKRGYTTDFNVENDCLVCHATPLKRMPDEFGISEVNGCEAWGEGLREVGSQNSEFRIQELEWATPRCANRSKISGFISLCTSLILNLL